PLSSFYYHAHLHLPSFPTRRSSDLADPPVLVARRLDEPIDCAFVAAGVQDLDRGAANVLVLVLDEVEDGVDDAWAADACKRVGRDRKSTRLNSSHAQNPYAVFCLKK